MTPPMHNHRPDSNAEPGTGTQYHVEASPPCGCRGELDAETCGDINHEHPNVHHYSGTRWKVGKEYFDTERRCMVELSAVVRKSTWCDTGDAEDGALRFRFQSDRDGSIELDPTRMDRDKHETSLDERFIETYTANPPLGAPNPPW